MKPPIPEDLEPLYANAIEFRHAFGSAKFVGAGTVEVLIERIAADEDLIKTFPRQADPSPEGTCAGGVALVHQGALPRLGSLNPFWSPCFTWLATVGWSSCRAWLAPPQRCTFRDWLALSVWLLLSTLARSYDMARCVLSARFALKAPSTGVARSPSSVL